MLTSVVVNEKCTGFEEGKEDVQTQKDVKKRSEKRKSSEDEKYRCVKCKKLKKKGTEGMGYLGGLMCQDCVEAGW